jgi:hypothetical protein
MQKTLAFNNPQDVGYRVATVSRDACKPFVLGIHYAKRWPSITHAFGLFRDGELVGVVTYGTPASAPLRTGIAGPEYTAHVLELNRLCLRDNLKNEASRLVSKSLKMLRGPHIVISFADTQMDHRGTVYQACSFTYHGLSAKRTDWKVAGQEHLHGQTIADRFRQPKHNGQSLLWSDLRLPKTRSEMMRETYQGDFYTTERARKHRYIFLIGSTGWKKAAFSKIRYPQEPFPK